MFMVSNEIKVALLTEHIPLSRVKDHLNKNLIEFRIKEVLSLYSMILELKDLKLLSYQSIHMLVIKV